MKTSILFSLCTLLLTSCDHPNIITEYDDNGAYIKYEINKEDSVRNGLSQSFDAQNRKLEQSQFVNGKLHGLRTIYDSTGQIAVEEHYRDGLFHGTYISYYANGDINLTGQYIDNKMTGKWKRYYDKGQLMESVNFEANEENGPFIEYHENGKLKAEGTYLNGDNEQGELKLYNINGILERKMNCVAGRCSTIWKLNDEVF